MSSPTTVAQDSKVDKEAASSQVAISRKLLDYALESPLKTLGSAVSILGGLLVLMFLTDIEFLPDVDLAGIASMLYAVALLGLTLLAAMVVLLVVPALAMRGVRDMSRRGPRHTATAAAPTAYPAEPMPSGSRPAACAETVPWIVAFVLWSVLLVWQVSDASQEGLRCFAAIAGGACLLGAVIWVWRESVAVRGWSTAKRRAISVRWIVADSVVAFVFFVMPVYVILRLAAVGDLGQGSISPPALLTLVLLLLVSAVVAWVLSTPQPQIGVGVGLAFGLALFFVVATQTGSVTAVPHTIVGKLHLGDIDFARGGVTAAGCRQINAALGATACAVGADAGAMTPLCPVRIRSRVGQQLVLEFGEVAWSEQRVGATKQWLAAWAQPKQRMRRVVLDKAEMPSWQPLQPLVDDEPLALTTSAKAAVAPKGLTLWRPAAAAQDERLQRLCDAVLESSPAVTPLSASSPASATPPPKARRG
ncbi:hypothetical protein J2X20_003740 [Pelomonas saccharophila]|uniref:Uncharacterized protein n=1 Tax=Roseateles saccharophilus TaxID=304 RepID=A0ABU1YQE4_ROSSA|nr:hypothetical protein [Roseateles saccharophilus]MDR7271082.1 hypothetical protein [Roseateles saccharophilus]